MFEVSTSKCQVEITSGLYYLSCTNRKCKKGLSQKDGGFWCDACETRVSFPRTRFNLHLDAKDDWAKTVITMFKDMAEKIMLATVKAILDGENEVSVQFSL
ncbi:nucleic acid-binding, OB-fold protein [Tanacetum coccineum]